MAIASAPRSLAPLLEQHVGSELSGKLNRLWKTGYLSGGGEALSQMQVAVTAHSVTPSAALGERQWFAAYTISRHEKRVAEHFAVREVESFLPLYRSTSRWKNGLKVELERPLFPNYIFVHISQRERSRVLAVPGVLSLAGSRQGAAALPPEFIELLRVGVHLRRVEPHPYLVVGQRARILRGPLEGMEGVVLRKKNSLRVVLTVELIMKSVAVEVEAEDLEPFRVPHTSLS